MNNQRAVYVSLRQAFTDALTYKQRRNLAWHAKQNTPVLCGGMASQYTDGLGGG